MKNERVRYIDLIRLFACICILVIHFNASVSGFDKWQCFYYPNSIVPNSYFGAYLGDIGVSLFFMISGASLMLSNEHTPLKTFFRKRFFNIYPMYWIAFGTTTLLSFLINKSFPMSKLYYLLFSIMGLDGYIATLGLPGGSFYQVGEWFLGCIILLYLTWPLLLTGLKKAPVLTWIITLTITLCFSRKNNIWFFVRFPEILFGMSAVKYRWDKRPIHLLLAAVSGALLSYYLYQKGVVWNFLWVNIFCALLFSTLLNVSQLIKSEAINSFLFKISSLTYPIFLVHHWIVHNLVKGFDLSAFPYRYTVVMFITYICLTLGSAVLLKKIGEIFTKQLKAVIENRMYHKNLC